MTRKIYLSILFLVPMLFLTACSFGFKESISSDGSVVVKQRFYIYDLIKGDVESGELNLIDEDSDLSHEDQILKEAISMSENLCNESFEEDSSFDYYLRDVFFACEVLDNGDLASYYVFAPGSFDFEIDGNIYKYYLEDLIIDHDLEGFLDDDFLDGYSHPEDILGSDFTLFFEGEIVSSDIGVVEGNKVSFDINEIKQLNSEGNNPYIKARISEGEIKSDKSVVSYHIAGHNLFYQEVERQSLSPYLDRIEQIWGYNQDELRDVLCSEGHGNFRYSSELYKIDCQSDGEMIVEKNKREKRSDSLVEEFPDFYQYNLLEVLLFEEMHNIDWPSEVNYYFPANSELHLTFFDNIKKANLGTIKNGNELVLSWDDVKSVNDNSIVEVYKNGYQTDDDQPERSINILNQEMYNNFRGKILLQVEKAGEAYYVHPEEEEMHFLGRPDDAFSIMRDKGIGITNSDLDKIPVSLDYLSGKDSSGDGLPDAFKEALGLDVNSTDSDGDGYDDYTELLHGYDPLGPGRLSYDKDFAALQAGKILLQVEQKGEAWYINPENNKRYFLGRPNDAFNIMRNLGLGISNADFDRMINKEE